MLFHPTADFSGAASFEYTVQDNGTTNGANDFLTDVGAASFTIDPAAEIPSATNSTTAEDTQSTSGLVLTPNAADGGTVTHFKITGITGGTLYQNNGTTLIANGDFITVADGGAGLKFTPASNLNSPAGDTFRFDAQAGLDGAGTGLSLGRSVTITVTEVNDVPTAGDDSLTSIAEDSGDRTIPFASLTGNDSKGPANENGQSLTVASVSNAVGGAVEIVGTNVIFHPTANLNGAASFDYTVQDNGTTNGSDDFKSDVGTATFTITEVNDAPTAVDDSLSSIAEESGDRTISFASLTGNDSKGPANESGQSLTITSVSNPIGGTAEIVGTDVIFHPALDFNGTASFDYTVQDDGTTNGASDPISDIGTVTFAITEVNDAPTAIDDALSVVAEDSGDRAIPFADLTGNDSKGPANESSQSLTIIDVSNPIGGTVEIVGTDVIFHPSAEFQRHGQLRLHRPGQRHHEWR